MPNCVSAEPSTVRYQVVHTTRYAYTESVLVSHHVARLSPRVLTYQDCPSHALEIDPPPSAQATHTDYFGNLSTFFAMQGAHTGLRVTARSTVHVAERAVPAYSATPPWEEAADRTALPLAALEGVFDPLASTAGPALAEYARQSFPHGRPLLEAVVHLTSRIYEDFTFDPRATTVTTSLADVLRLRRGVCQDFARVGIACLRVLGIPALYVSGYLETAPPPGKPRRIGADASHAWFSVYCPGHGWIDVDPTNNVVPRTGHITLAWGRDYTDVSPIRGVILGGGGHSLEVNVDVVRVE
jgi:transglutaminase-like putative cysteine protease